MPGTRRVSLRVTISTLVIALLLATVAGVLLISFLIRGRTIAATAQILQTEVSTRITERVIERFGPINGLLHGLSDAVIAKRLATDDETLVGELSARMRHEDRVEWIAWIRPDGTGVGAVTHPEGVMVARLVGSPEVEIEIWRSDGTRTKAPSRVLQDLQNAPWVDAAAAGDGPTWSAPYIRALDGQPGRACAIAVREDGELEGVFGVGFSMGFMRSYLNSIRIGESGAVFGLSRETRKILSSPSEEALTRLGPAVMAALDDLPGPLDELEPGVLHTLPVEHGGVGYQVGVALQRPEGLPSWVHAIVSRDDELVGYFGGYLLWGLLAVGALLLAAVLLARALSGRVARSLDEVVGDMQRVGSFELTPRSGANSRIHEIAVVSEATERMKASLRSFGRYVPTELVRELLAQGQEARLDGVTRPLTLFFSDVAGFTSSSEGMAPTALVDALGSYLDVLCGAVEGQHGTIDKFIGDGVLAFFNAPRDDADHVAHGCRAALAVQAALDAAGPGWREQGLPDFTTRIGLHTAEVVVGNIGTPERFAYTVIGDGVNLAARLESLNKAYGTLILVSEEVREIAGDAFVFRAIDRTAVVGRKTGGTVYELVGHAGNVSEDRLAICSDYERAFALYLDRRFTEAADLFEQRASEDQPSAVLAGRALAFEQAPPPADWDGVFVQKKK